MQPSTSLQKAEAYLHLQLSRRRPLPGSRSMPFITLSRQAGAGASSLAQLVAPLLDAERAPEEAAWTIFDGNLVETMLDTHHFAATLAQYLPEDAVPEVTGAVGELVGLHPSLWDLRQRTNDLIRKLARLGHCILVGRGANFATSDLPHGVHVRLVGSPVQRARRTAGALGVNEAAAAARNLSADVARRRYVRQTFGRDVDDPAAYDLVINTDHVSLGDAARLVADVVRSRHAVDAT